MYFFFNKKKKERKKITKLVGEFKIIVLNLTYLPNIHQSNLELSNFPKKKLNCCP